MNNFTCRYLSDFTDEALKPLDKIAGELSDLESFVNSFNTEEDDIDGLCCDVSTCINNIQGYIEEIRERF